MKIQVSEEPPNPSASVPTHAEEHGKSPKDETFVVVIDAQNHRVPEPRPTGSELLALVGKRPCRYQLIQLERRHEEELVDPDERVDLVSRARNASGHRSKTR